MAINGGVPDPAAEGVATIATNNPSGGIPAATWPAKSGTNQQDLVVTTNPHGGYAAHNRPHS